MGDVYRARDTQLQRDVALKILPGVADGPLADARIARFKREAQLLASLNHPNVAAIYGFVEGRIGRLQLRPMYALALELVEGPTLAERIVAVRFRWTRRWQSRGKSLKVSRLRMRMA